MHLVLSLYSNSLHACVILAQRHVSCCHVTRRSIECLCACCCSRCLGQCAAWTLLSSPPSSTPSSPWSWPGTYRPTNKVKTSDISLMSRVIVQCLIDPPLLYCLSVCLPSEHQKMCYTALVLTMIFSMGEQVPYHHYGMKSVADVA